MSTFLSQEVDYLGSFDKILRDLRGYATLANELIQNADDVEGATRISFDVCNDGLHVYNDGVFSDCGDVEAQECPWKALPQNGRMCDFHRFRKVASGNKRHQGPSTGAFGIGFVSVYQITDHPELWSSGRHWRLNPDQPANERIKQDLELTEGTHFFFPWARDPESPLRRALAIEHIDDAKITNLEETLRVALPNVILFLRRLNRIELTRNGGSPLAVTREVHSPMMRVDVDSAPTYWYTISGSFETDASELRAAYPGKIEAKRASTVTIAIPDYNPQFQGLLCAFLPTEQSTTLPFHINADFFPTSDRKRIAVDDFYQGAWNTTAIDAAANALAGALPDLRGTLGHRHLWSILEALKNAHSAQPRPGDPTFRSFWAVAQSVLKASPIVYSSKGIWCSSSDVYLLEKKDDELTTPLLERLGLSIVHKELRPYFTLLRDSSVGVGLVSAQLLCEAIEQSGLRTSVPVGQAPAWYRDPQLLLQLDQLVQSLTLNPQTDLDRKEARSAFRGTAIALGADDYMHRPEDLYQVDPETYNTFYTFLGGEYFPSASNPPSISALVPMFTVEDAIDLLERLPADDFADINNSEPEKLSDLLRWFAGRSAELKHSPQFARRLAALPMWPSSTALHSLSDLAVPGSFNDPLNLASVVDTVRLKGLRDFLLDLGAKELTINTYTTTQVPLAFQNTTPIPVEARRKLLGLLADNFGRFSDDRAVKTALQRLPLVECTDGEFRRPYEVYFDDPVITDVLGPDAPLAKQLDENAVAIANLLAWLGVYSEPRAANLLARVKSLTVSTSLVSARESVERIFIYLGRQWPKLDPERRSVFAELRNAQWLPGTADLAWHKPSDLYATFQRYIFENQANFLAVKQASQAEATAFMAYLGVSDKPSTDLVVKHLLHCAAEGILVNRQVYPFLNNDYLNPAIAALKGEKCILLESGSYILPSHAFWGPHNFGKYRVQLNPEFRVFNSLFKVLGVRDSPDWSDAIEVLKEISFEWGRSMLPIDSATRDVILYCWTLLSHALQDNQLSDESILFLSGHRVIPDSQGLMRLPVDLFFEDRPGLLEHFADKLEHRVIIHAQGAWLAMEAAGVRRLSQVVSRDLAERGGTIPDEVLTAAVRERAPLVARVIEPHRTSSADNWRLEILERLIVQQSTGLEVLFTLDAGTGRVATDPQPVFAYFDPYSEVLYYQHRDPFPWPPMARELAIALNPFTEPGLIAPALKDILSVPSVEEGDQLLGELGYAPLLVSEASSPTSTVVSLGGLETSPSDTPQVAAQETSSQPAPGEPDQPRTTAPAAATGPIAAKIGETQPLPAPSPEGPGTNGHAEDQQHRASGDGRVEHSRADSKSSSPPSAPQSKEATGSLQSARRVTYAVTKSDNRHNSHSATSNTELIRKIEQAGIDAACAFEDRCERDPTVMPRNNPGFDIKSVDRHTGEVRYIEVKAIGSIWDQYGVALTATEFSIGREQRMSYWLYVVENATSDSPCLYRIQDPANKPDEFAYDRGWATVAETD